MSQSFIKKHCVCIDWKMELEESIPLLKRTFFAYAEIFELPSFQELIENYSAESPEEYLLAIGQELSSHDLILYTIHEESDQYCLYIHPKEDMEAFEKKAKTEKIRLNLQKQPRKKLGEPAKRLQLANRLPYEIYKVDGNRVDLDYPLSIVKGKWISLGMDKRGNGLYIGAYYTFLNLEKWKPEEKKITMEYTPSGIDYYAYSSQHKLYCAIFKHTAIDTEQNRTFSTHLRITLNPFELSHWEEISCEEELPALASPFWVGDDIVLGYKNKAWIVQNAAHGGRICEKLWESQSDAGGKDYYPHSVWLHEIGEVLSIHGELLYLDYKKETSGNWLFKKNVSVPYLQKITKIGDPIHRGTLSFEKNKLIYIAQGVLVELDLMARKVIRTCTLKKLRDAMLKKLNEDWAIIYQLGYPSKEYDLAQLWNFKNNTWLNIEFGALGKYTISDIMQHPEGYTLIEIEDGIMKIDNFIELVQNNQKKGFTQEWQMHQ